MCKTRVLLHEEFQGFLYPSSVYLIKHTLVIGKLKVPRYMLHEFNLSLCSIHRLYHFLVVNECSNIQTPTWKLMYTADIYAVRCHLIQSHYLCSPTVQPCAVLLP